MTTEQTQGPTTPAETTPPPATAPETNAGQSPATFTQADVDRIVGERAKRASEAAINKLLADLGIEDTNKLKAELEAKRQRDIAEMSEGDKLKAELEALKAAKEAAESKALAAEAKQLETVRDTAIIGALTGADRPQSVLTLLKTEHADQVTAVLKDDGSIDDKALKELDTLARKEYANNFKAPGHGSGSHAGGKVPTDEKQRERLWRRQTVTPSKRGFN